MFKTRNLKKYSISLLFGILFLVVSVLISMGFFNHQLNDFAFGSFSSELSKNNLIVYYTSYFSGTLLALFGYSSYLIPVFFIIFGIKKIINIKTNFFFIHLIFLILGISLLSLLMIFFRFDTNIIGLFGINFIYTNLYETINNDLYYYVLIFVIFIFSVFFILYGLTIKNKIVFIIFKFCIALFFSIFKNLKLNFIYSVFKKIQFKPNEENPERKLLRKNKISKKEPGFFKNNREYSSTTKDVFAHSSNKYSLPPLSLLKKTERTKYDTRDQLKINQERAKRLERAEKTEKAERAKTAERAKSNHAFDPFDNS